MLILGIDPGLSGALALYNTATGSLVIDDMPTFSLTRGGKAKRDVNVSELARIIDSGRPARAFLERVGAMPGQGVSSVFKFGEAFGIVRGCLAFVPTELVAPTVWRKAVGIKTGAGKDTSRARATALFPRYANQFARVKDDGRAEAALIAYYGGLHVAAEAGRAA